MEISQEQFERIKDCLPRQRGNVRVGNRTLLNALLYVLEQGCKWRGLPRSFGPWHTIYTRLNRWSKKGVIEGVFVRLQEEQILAIKLEVVSLDSTSIKVHPDGTGARKKTVRKPSANRVEAGRPRFIWWPRLRGAP
jgi:transposase